MSKINELFSSKLKVVNVGLETFHDANKHQKIECIHVDWRPAAGGNSKLLEILEKLNK